MNRPHALRMKLRRAAALLTQTRTISSTRSLWRSSSNNDDITIKESYYHGSSSKPLIGKTIGVALQETAEKFPDKDAFIYGVDGTRHTYSQLLDEVDRLAAGFLAMGITKGDRLGMWGPNIEEWVLTQYAAARIGAILVNVNPAYRVQELEYSMNKVGMKAIVAPQSFKVQDYYGMLTELCPEMKTCKPGKLRSKRAPTLRSIVIAGSDSLTGALKFDDVRGMGGDKRHDIEEIGRTFSFDEPISLQFTSGTTGLPKGTTLTHHNILNNAYFTGLVMGYDKANSVICETLPLYHSGGCVCGSIATIVHGTTTIFPAPGHDPQKILQAIEKEKCTVLYGTPTIYVDTFSQPNSDDFDTSSLTLGGIGGSTCPPQLLKLFQSKMNMTPVVTYGMTESSPLATITQVGDSDDIILNTVGKALDHIEVKIVDPQTKMIVPVDERGEVCIRGYSVMRGYWNDPEKTAETIDEEGWLHTGDLGVMNEKGYCNIVGRMKDLIIRGGSNIFPAEIEIFLHQHPKIADVQVVGVPDDRLGEEICACVKVAEGESCTPEEIKDFCEGQIAHNKVPRYIEFVDSFPMTVTMKVQKTELSRMMTEKLGL